ncbi:UPF0481 protein At3g47200-like [Syzygium oleosum]|uniref:UPF0481 protein At3g47200-like n=1 Tax=Syzygium oleosum TaxID=219896 RepID=UPI0011D2393D|nr:UPF0481 protein At3g47200-like [Syzygium oleosum]
MANNEEGRQATTQHEIQLMRQQLLPSMSEDIEAALKSLNESTGESSCSIFRVPQALAGGIAEACLPRIVSIGPYHHGESQLQMFQGHKWRYLHTMLERTQPHGICLGNLIEIVASKEKMIRQCYSESIDNFSGPDLVKMMVLDGCFIIEFLRQIAGYIRPDKILLINSNSFVLLSLGRDLLRLENQVPYFVLEDLFEMTNIPKTTSSLDNLAFRFFSCFLEGPAIVGERPRGVHLLDLFRLSLIPRDQQDNLVEESSSYHTIRSASEFRRVGIGFKRSEASTFLEIKFDSKRRTVGIPKIEIDHDLNCILSNMVAFEQCRGQVDGHITTYAMFMGCLIHTGDDVQLLRDRKVISNHGMSNEDVARFFGDLCKDVYFDVRGSYLRSHFAILNEYLKYERAYLCYAQLLNAFHDNPWSVLSGLAVVVTLIGMIQSVYTVLQYYHPK